MIVTNLIRTAKIRLYSPNKQQYYGPFAVNLQKRNLAHKTLGIADFFDEGGTWKNSEHINIRAWEEHELAIKSFSDLHKLWWICLKEKNKILSYRTDCTLLKFTFPEKKKLELVEKTMKNIRSVIWKRVLDRKRALKTLEIVKGMGDLKEGEEVCISEQQKYQIIFEGMSHLEIRKYKETLQKALEEKSKMRNVTEDNKKESFIKLQ